MIDDLRKWILAGLYAGLSLAGAGPLIAQAIPPPRAWATRSPAGVTVGETKGGPVQLAPPSAGNGSKETMTTPASPPTLLDPNTRAIDLNTALRLAGVQNPQLMIARERVLEAAALRQLAAAQFLPSLNLGTNYDAHTGNLQQSDGNILGVNRSAVYVGAGASAIGSGTVTIPGVFLQGNIAAGVYGYLAARQVVAQREFASLAIRNQTFLQTTLAYSELLRSEGRRAVALQVRDEARRVAELTAAYANAGQGLRADAHRALTELEIRENDVLAAEGEILVSSARLCYVLNLDPTLRLHPTDAFIVPHPIVPDPTSIGELIALGLLQRPELGARRAAIVESLLYLEGAKVLPFSPTILIGYSSGGFGGGSNLVRPVFGGFGGRSDFDAMAYWTLQNLGVGNLAMINLAKAKLGVTRYQEIAVLDQVRAEVAEAYAKTHARYARIEISERAVRSATRGFREDLLRIENTVAPAIETVNSLTLLARSRSTYLNAIVDYNRAQFELFVALGQPPADSLARPVPTEGVTPPGEPLRNFPKGPLSPDPDGPATSPLRNARRVLPASPTSPTRPPA